MSWLDALAEVLSPSGADIGAKENVAVIKKVKGGSQFSDLKGLHCPLCGELTDIDGAVCHNSLCDNYCGE